MTTLLIAPHIPLDKRGDLSKSFRLSQSKYWLFTTIVYSITAIFIGTTSANAAVPPAHRVYSYEYIHYEIVKFEREVWDDQFKNIKKIFDREREISNHYSPSERIDLLTFVSDSQTLISAQRYLLKEGDYLVTQWRTSKPKAKDKRLRSLEHRVTRVQKREEFFQNLQILIASIQDDLDSQTSAQERFVPTDEFSFEAMFDQEKNLRMEYEEFNQSLTAVLKAEPYSAVNCFELIAEADQLLADVKSLADVTFNLYVEFPRKICHYFAESTDLPAVGEFCRESQSRFNLYEKNNLFRIDALKSRIDYFEFILQKPRSSMVF